MPQYHLLLSRISTPLLCLILLSTLTCTCILSLLASSLSPDTQQTESLEIRMDTQELTRVFNGSETLKVTPFTSTPLNQHLSFHISLSTRTEYLRASPLLEWSDSFEYYINVVGCDALEGCNAEDVWEGSKNGKRIVFEDDFGTREVTASSSLGVPLTDYTQVRRKSLSCGPFPALSANTPAFLPCHSLLLFNEPTIRYPYYSIALKFANTEEKLASRQLKYYPRVVMGYTYVDAKYALTDIVLGYIFIALNALMLLVFLYIAMVRRSMRFFQWETEQKFIVILLIFLILYNNPLNAIQYFMNNMFNTFLSVLFKANFFGVLLFGFLVMLHSVYVKQQDRGTSFYVTKAILIGALWACFVLTFMYTALQQLQDPTAVFDPEDQPVYVYVQWTMISLFVIYLFCVAYYITRIVGLSFKLSTTSSLKFRIVALVTILLFSFLIIYLTVLNAFGKLTQSLTLIAFNLIINFYVILLAVLYLPSSRAKGIVDADIDAAAMLGVMDHEL